MDLTQKLITQAATDVTGGTVTKWGDQEIDWANWQRLTMRQAIIRYWPEACGCEAGDERLASHSGVQKLVERFNRAHAHMAYDRNEPHGKNDCEFVRSGAEEHLTQPTIIYEFPTAVSPLSKQKPDEPDWTERWEILRRQDGDRQRLQRTQRSGRSAAALREPVARPRARRRRGTPDGRGLHPRAVVWNASGGRMPAWAWTACACC